MALGFGKNKDDSNWDPTPIEAALNDIKDPSLGISLGKLGWLHKVRIKKDKASLSLGLPFSGYAHADTLETAMTEVCHQAGIDKVKIEHHLSVPQFRGHAKKVVPGVGNLIAVASGKGGVGKSTVALNLALTLDRMGFKTAFMDCDIYGPSLPAMVGTRPKPRADARNRIIPEKIHNLTTMSMGFLLEPGQAATWRGPMLHKMIQQFLFNVAWGEQDFMILDLPPGTGDVQLSLTQESPVSAAVIVTTPQEAALADARKGVEMFSKVDVPVLGFVENMAYYTCRKCSKEHQLFQKDGGQRIANEYKLPLIAQLPLDPALPSGNHDGLPLVVRDPNHPVSAKFGGLAQEVCLALHKLIAQWQPTQPHVMEV